MPKWLSIRLRMLAGAALLGCIEAAAASGAQAHPDFSGVWGPYVEPGRPSIRALRANMKLPLTPGAQKKVDEYRALVTPGDDNPGKFCLGYGMPESMVFSGGYPMEIVQREDEILIVYEAYGELRHIYFGGRISAPGDRVPDRDGYSTGRWEGDTLVVDTSSLKEQEDELYPHSDQAHIVERYHLTHDAKGDSVLVDDWTLTDPAFYDKPIKAQKKWSRDPTQVFLPYECNEEGWLDHLDALRKSKGATLPPVY